MWVNHEASVRTNHVRRKWGHVSVDFLLRPRAVVILVGVLVRFSTSRVLHGRIYLKYIILDIKGTQIG